MANKFLTVYFFPLQTVQEIDDPNYNEKVERMAGTIEVS